MFVYQAVIPNYYDPEVVAESLQPTDFLLDIIKENPTLLVDYTNTIKTRAVNDLLPCRVTRDEAYVFMSSSKANLFAGLKKFSEIKTKDISYENDYNSGLTLIFGQVCYPGHRKRLSQQRGGISLVAKLSYLLRAPQGNLHKGRDSRRLDEMVTQRSFVLMTSSYRARESCPRLRGSQNFKWSYISMINLVKLSCMESLFAAAKSV